MIYRYKTTSCIRQATLGDILYFTHATRLFEEFPLTGFCVGGFVNDHEQELQVTDGMKFREIKGRFPGLTLGVRIEPHEVADEALNTFLEKKLPYRLTLLLPNGQPFPDSYPLEKTDVLCVI